jgi:hypothetical protein
MGTIESTAARVDSLYRHAHHLVRPLGTVRLGSEPAVIQRPASEPWDWIVMDLAHDPAFQNGTLAIPRAAKRHIAAVQAAGVEFDRLHIAHEVPKVATLPAEFTAKKGWEGELILATINRSSVRAAEKLDRAVGTMSRTAVKVGGGLAALAALPAALSDPILMGGILISSDKTTETLAIFEIARWNIS